jgi:hypothetical protein
MLRTFKDYLYSVAFYFFSHFLRSSSFLTYKTF